MIVVNLFGSPGAGKSTSAAYIFSRLKMAGINVELITEFAKAKVWENTAETFKPDNQCYLFGKQFYRMSCCRDKVDVLVTDCPLPISILFNSSEVLGESFNQVVMNCYNSFENINYFLTRDTPYSEVGRHETEEESDELSKVLKNILDTRNIEYTSIASNKNNYRKIAEDVINRLTKSV